MSLPLSFVFCFGFYSNLETVFLQQQFLNVFYSELLLFLKELTAWNGFFKTFISFTKLYSILSLDIEFLFKYLLYISWQCSTQQSGHGRLPYR
jgi:hypothetical protein